MGLFKSVGKVLGIGGGSAPQFTPDLREYKADVGKVRSLRDAPITGIRQSAELSLGQLDKERQREMGDVQSSSMGRFAALQDELARQGGIDSGARERLAGLSQREATMARQRAGADFGRMRSDLYAGDIAAQEDLKNQALFRLPQMSLAPTDIQARAAAANMQARALHEQSNRSQVGALGSVLGGAAGAYFTKGGAKEKLMGSMMGSGMGGGLFSGLY